MPSKVIPVVLSAICTYAWTNDCDWNGEDDAIEVLPVLELDERVRFAVGEEPTTLALGDLNADGVLDLAVTCTKSDSVVVLLGDVQAGERLFDVPTEMCVGVDPRGIALGDVTQDGKIDLVVGSEGRRSDPPDQPRPRVTVLRGLGNGQLEPSCAPPCLEKVPAACEAGDYVASKEDLNGVRTLALADLDEDGALDVVVGFRSTPGTVAALFGNARGSFGEAMVLNATALLDTRYIAVVDLDGDQYLDVVTASAELLRGPFSVRSAPVKPFRLSEESNTPRGVLVLDVDGDTRADVVIAASAPVAGGAGSGQVTVLRNDPDGRFDQLPQPDLDGLCDLLESVGAADLDSDGDADLILNQILDPTGMACAASGLQVLLNDGSGRFMPGIFFPTNSGRPRWVAAGDFTGEGQLDLAVALNLPAGEADQVAVIVNATAAPSADQNRNGVVDACEFFRGDVDRNLRLSIADPIGILHFLFQGVNGLSCLEASDVDDNGLVNLSDAVALLLYLFQGGPAPPPPGLAEDGSCLWPNPWTDSSGILDCSPGCGA